MPKFTPTTMIGVVVALGLVILGALGLLANPKPDPATPGAADATRASAEKPGAKVTLTVNQ